MEYLGIEEAQLSQLGGIHTAIEITQQPEVWQQVWEQININKSSLGSFLKKALSNTQRIILTGAGTSAFIGISLRGIFQQKTGIVTEAIATTDIVSHPNDYFLENIPTLLVSFARSGNSPESVATVELADEICKTCYHLIITCNEDGNLAQYASSDKKHVILLPQKSNDISLAMTSSYTSMLLTGLLAIEIDNLSMMQKNVEGIIDYATDFISKYAYELRELAKKPFKRAVFLGSGCLYGTATESHLKLQELTDGKVICKNDSYLGFRHGPKAVVDEDTMMVYIISASNDYALKYELDLIRSMKKGTHPMIEVCISESSRVDLELPFMFHFSENENKIDDAFLSICYVLPAQILGFFKSLELGLRPDSPSSNNDISRVVQGVQIYSIA